MEPLVWHTYEYLHTPKNRNWYFAVSIISVSLIVSSIILDNYLFAIVILCGAVSVFTLANRVPLYVECSIGEEGVRFGKYLYPFSELESFWVEEDTMAHPKIVLKSKRTLSPLIVILRGDASRDELRMALKRKLLEVEHGEPLINKILELAGF